MKVAFLSHFYPPSPSGGAGIYAATLAEGWQQSGVNTCVLCAGDWDRGTKYFNGYTDDVYHDVPVRRLHVNWTKARKPFDYLFDSSVLAGHIRDFLEEVRPDLVHVISCYTLSAQAIRVPEILDIPTVVHLVDMWFICPHHTLLRKDGTLCHGLRNHWDCQSCMLHGTKADRWTRAALSDGLRSRLFSRLGKIPLVTRLPGLVGMLGDMKKTRRSTLEALCLADAIIAPSRTVLELHVQNGVPPHRIQLLPHGHNIQWANQVRRAPSPQLRIGFLGNIIPIKGVHVLIEAFERLRPSEKVRLEIHGNDSMHPTYAAELKSNLPPNVFWHGAYQRNQLASILSDIDVLVVPSIWLENHPLVIREGYAAGCPVIVSNLGGMAEAVIDGVNGLHFRAGDCTHLAQQIERLIQEPDLLSQMQANIPAVKTVAQELDELRPIYANLIQSNIDGKRKPCVSDLRS